MNEDLSPEELAGLMKDRQLTTATARKERALAVLDKIKIGSILGNRVSEGLAERMGPIISIPEDGKSKLIQNVHWPSGASDMLFTSTVKMERSITGEVKPSAVIINRAYRTQLKGEPNFLREIDEGSFEGELLGSGREHTAFKVDKAGTEMVLTYPTRGSWEGKEGFAATGLDSFAALRAVSEFSDVRVVAPILATRSVLVSSYQEGETVHDRFTREYGVGYDDSDEYREDPLFKIVEKTKGKIQEALIRAEENGHFDFLDDPGIWRSSLDSSYNNLKIDPETGDLVFFDPLGEDVVGKA